MKNRWSGNNRARWHDYRSKCIYHITLMKDPAVEFFGQIGGDWRIKPGNPGSPYLVASPTGRKIKEALKRLPDIHPALRLYQYALMPDHLHLLIAITSPLDDILGRKLAIFKVIADRFAEKERVFLKGFNDQIIGPNRKLDDIYNYLRENPYRLAVRMAHPESFRRVTHLEIHGKAYSAYGNLHLLSNPFKEQVVVHRAEDAATRERNKERWIHCVANGGVLVSPFISKDEKAIRQTAESLDGKIILLTDTSFDGRGKPGAHDFDQCCRNKLLVMTPAYEGFQPASGRKTFMALNECARQISEGG